MYAKNKKEGFAFFVLTVALHHSLPALMSLGKRLAM